MPLNARQIETAKPKEKEYKLTDGGGLYLLVKPNGAKYWRLKYRVLGKEKKLSIGVYPDISLADARQKREDARKVVALGGDPGEEKKAEKLAKKANVENTFKAIALEWHEYKRPNWSKGYAEDLMEAFENDIFPDIGKRPIAEIKPLEVLSSLRKLEKRGVLDKLRKIRQACNQVFRYAIVTGRAETNPASELASALTAPKSIHYPHLLADELPTFLQALAAYSGSPITRLATRILMLTGVRTIMGTIIPFKASPYPGARSTRIMGGLQGLERHVDHIQQALATLLRGTAFAQHPKPLHGVDEKSGQRTHVLAGGNVTRLLSALDQLLQCLLQALEVVGHQFGDRFVLTCQLQRRIGNEATPPLRITQLVFDDAHQQFPDEILG